MQAAGNYMPSLMTPLNSNSSSYSKNPKLLPSVTSIFSCHHQYSQTPKFLEPTRPQEAFFEEYFIGWKNNNSFICEKEILSVPFATCTQAFTESRLHAVIPFNPKFKHLNVRGEKLLGRYLMSWFYIGWLSWWFMLNMYAMHAAT